jgi:Domain of unknown function (DUF4279)
MYFDFYGESFDPMQITDRLGFNPTSQFRRGEPMAPPFTGSRRRDGWVLRAGSAETFDLDELLDQLKAAVTASPEAIQAVVSEFHVDAVVTCEIVAKSEVMPAVVFPPDFVEWAALRGITVRVDIMAYTEDDEDEAPLRSDE